MDPAKIKCVLQWPVPKNVKGISGFLGLTGYYRKFMKGYSKLAKPLTDLTKRKFKRGAQEQVAFEVLKHKVTTSPVLALSDFSLEFYIESDASVNSLGNSFAERAGNLIFQQNTRGLKFNKGGL